MENAELTIVDNILELAPIEAGKLGHHTVLKAPDARVVVLALAAGQGMKEHATAKGLLLQALDGRVRITVGEQSVELVPAMLLRIDPLVRHEVEAIEDTRLMLTLLG